MGAVGGAAGLTTTTADALMGVTSWHCCRHLSSSITLAGDDWDGNGGDLTLLLLRPPAPQVAAPRVGERHPASVTAEVTIDTRGMRSDVAAGWDELKQHDVLFLLAGVL